MILSLTLSPLPQSFLVEMPSVLQMDLMPLQVALQLLLHMASRPLQLLALLLLLLLLLLPQQGQGCRAACRREEGRAL